MDNLKSTKGKVLTFILGFLLFFSPWSWLHAQSLDLATCYEKARAVHPLAAQRSIFAEAAHLQKAALATNLMPKVQLNAQATYQSDVTSIPVKLPNITIPTPDKDQYKATLDVSHILYDGKAIKSQMAVQDANLATQQQQVEVNLFGIKERINGLYFNVLLTDENVALTQLLRQDIQTRLDRVKAGLRNGVGAPISAMQLEAQLAQLEIQRITLQQNRKAALQMLGELIGESLPETTKLTKPVAALPMQVSLQNRPEMLLFEAQRNAVSVQQNALQATQKPKVSAFLQTGFGRPALNMFSSSFDPFAIGGMRLSWTLWDGRITQKQRASLETQKRLVQTQENAFLQSQRMQIVQYQNEIEKMQALLVQDETIVMLRTKIKENVAAQLENGVATANDYLLEANAENQVRQNQKLHELQLLMARINLKTMLNE